MHTVCCHWVEVQRGLANGWLFTLHKLGGGQVCALSYACWSCSRACVLACSADMRCRLRRASCCTRTTAKGAVATSLSIGFSCLWCTHEQPANSLCVRQASTHACWFGALRHCFACGRRHHLLTACMRLSSKHDTRGPAHTIHTRTRTRTRAHVHTNPHPPID